MNSHKPQIRPHNFPYIGPTSRSEAMVEEASAIEAIAQVVRDSGVLAPEYFAQEEVA